MKVEQMIEGVFEAAYWLYVQDYMVKTTLPSRRPDVLTVIEATRSRLIQLLRLQGVSRGLSKDLQR